MYCTTKSPGRETFLPGKGKVPARESCRGMSAAGDLRTFARKCFNTLQCKIIILEKMFCKGYNRTWGKEGSEGGGRYVPQGPVRSLNISCKSAADNRDGGGTDEEKP